MSSSYYRAPEGEDIEGKLSYVISRSLILGTAAGIFQVKLLSNPKGILPTIGGLFYWSVPLAAMSTGFVTTTYIATNLRQKDDKINYALGGAVAGSIWGAFRKNARLGLMASVALSFVAVLKKEAVEEGWTFFPSVVRQHQGIGSPNYDFTLAPHIPGNWTTGRD